MKASIVATWVLASGLACACAEGYAATELGRRDSAARTPTASDGSPVPIGGAGGDIIAGGNGGAPAPTGEPCVRGDIAPCPCEGSNAQGQRTCRADMASQTQGFFSECRGCPMQVPPDEPPPEEQTPEEPPPEPEPTPDPPPDASVEQEPPPAEEPIEPVEDCDGVPEGTECDRDCILPSNTARCNRRGACSCL